MKVSRTTFDQLRLCGVHLLNGVSVAMAHALGAPIGGTLLISSLVATITYGLQLRRNLRVAGEWPSLLDLWLIAGTLRVGIGGVFNASRVLLDAGGPLRIGPVHLTDYILEGQAYLLVGDAMLIAGYLLAQPRRVGIGARSREVAALPLAVMAALLVGITVAMRVAWGDGRGIGGLGQVIAIVTDYGVAAALLLGLMAWARWKRGQASRNLRLWWWISVVACVALEIAWQLGSYMRHGVIITFIPLAAFAWWRWRNGVWTTRWLMTGGGAALAFTVLILWPYGELRRPDAWVGQTRIDVRELPVLPYLQRSLEAAIPGTEAWSEVHRYPDRGLWTFFNRAQITTPAALAAYFRHNRPDLGPQLLQAAFTNLIPRFIWPEKPPFAPGRVVTVAIGQAVSTSQATTSTSVTMQGAAAWGLGPVLGLGLLAFTGAGISLLWAFWVRRLLHNPVATLAAVSLWTQAVRSLASESDLAVTLLLYHLLVLVPLAIGWDVLTNRRRLRAERSTQGDVYDEPGIASGAGLVSLT